jgi:hypothetical protein
VIQIDGVVEIVKVTLFFSLYLYAIIFFTRKINRQIRFSRKKKIDKKAGAGM